MRSIVRSLFPGLAMAGAVATLTLANSGVAGAANTALMINGIAGGTDLPDLVMANVLGGMFRSYQRQNIPWPQQARPVTGPRSLTLDESIAQGADNLDAALSSALTQLGPGEHVTLVGLSAGSLVLDEEVRRLAADPNAPDKSQLNLAVVADSSRMAFNKNRYDGILNYTYTPPADTKYDTTWVTAEYDGFADFPDRWWNGVAVANALAGMVVRHVPNMLFDLSNVPPSNIAVTTNPLGGVTTSYLIPAAHLPLVTLVPVLGPREAQIRKIVDSAYKRNDNGSAVAAAAVAVVRPELPEGQTVKPAQSSRGRVRSIAVSGTVESQPGGPKATAASRGDRRKPT